jgi:hypothetical protein
LFGSARAAERVTPQRDVELVTEKQVFNSSWHRDLN